ncbi:MAG: type II secretion system F family protein [Bacillota bacterium]
MNIAVVKTMPEVIIPAVLVAAAVMSICICRNIEKFRRSASRLKEILEYEARQRDSAFTKYKVARDAAYKLNRLGAPVNYNAFLVLNLAISLALAVVSIKVLSNPLLAAILMVIWMLFSHQLVDRLYRTRVKAKIDAQAQLALQLIAELYSVSDNLVQAIERVIPSTPRPLRRDLENLVLQVKTNKDFDRCLLDFAANIDNRDIETFVHGIILAEHFGTETHEVIMKNAEVIRDRIALREELIDETKGKKAIIHLFMIILPVVFLWLFTGSDDARRIFTDTAKGNYLVSLLAVVEYLCWYFDSRKGVAEEL